MKRCLTCNATFDEEHLSFCINDGTPLVDGDIPPELEMQPTRIFAEPPPTVKIPPSRPTEYVPREMPSAPPPAPYGWANEAPPAWVPPPPPPARVAGPKQGLAVGSFVLGLVSVTVGWCCYFGVLTAPIAVGLGIFSLIQIKNNPGQYSGKPLAIIGIVTGSLYFLAAALIILLYGLSFLVGGLK
ncbi:MAG: DUF4190 domain-containing protein [Pyrinomonadaceae bacterium]